ncbi:MAG: efflux RND transporter periplasmic adaptor subunit [Proteobacteria bacterium]|nr:efflux RND transporter periplasmic adaptor subunit [Pseudomonadota bacterium]
MAGQRYFVLLAALLVGLTGLAGCQGEHQKKVTARDLAPVQVRVVTVTRQELPAQIELVGTVVPVNRAAIAAKVTGTIEKMPVVLGSQVKKGELLVQISAEEISAKVIQAQAQLAQAKRNLDREEKLLKKNAATSENVKALRDMYRVAKAAYDGARAMLGYTTITAPFNGQVTRKLANVGDLATPGTPLLEMENNRQLQVVTAVPEGLVMRIKTGDHLAVSIPAVKLVLAGTVAEIAPAVDPLSRTSTVKINIAETAHLHSGQFARVALPGKTASNIFVPPSAIISFGQMNKIFVAVNGKAHLRLVRTGIHQDGKIEILSGLNPGDRVIVDNNKLLIDGQPLTITP